MRQFTPSDQEGMLSQRSYTHSSFRPYAAACMEELGTMRGFSDAAYCQTSSAYYAQQTLKRNLAALCLREEEVKITAKRKRTGDLDDRF